jgi:hypothetical protein
VNRWGPVRSRPAGSRLSGDAGTGLIATFAAVLVFLAFLLFAVQLLISLFATSAVTSAAFDGARMVAGARTAHRDPGSVLAARRLAESRMRAELGTFGATVRFDWSGSDDQEVQVRIEGDAPRFFFPGLQHLAGSDHIDRSARVRVEAWR